MQIAKFQMPDGRVARFEVPEGTTPEQAQQMMQEHFAQAEQAQQAQPEKSVLDQLGRQAGLTARYGIEGIGDVVGIVQNPLSVITGGAIPRAQDVYPALATRMGLPQPETEGEKLVGAASRGVVGAGTTAGAGGLSTQAPGLIGQAGKFFATQPAAQLTAAATGAGSAELARQSDIGPMGQLAAGIAGGLAPSTMAKGLPALGGKIADIIGGLGTHTGGESLRQAARAGQQGGQVAESFQGALRGKTQMTDVLDDVRANLAEMGRQKAEAYRQGMAAVSGDKTILKFEGVDDALQKAFDMATFKGQIKNRRAANALQDVNKAVAEWKNLDPAQYHTPEGLDALKQQIGGMLESIPFEEKTARNAVGNVYNAIKSEISKQAPTYAKTMKGYSDATETIREVERALSAGKQASADTAMRKLQSLMRNNVSTNYGNRLELARAMEQQGGREIMPALAGQSLSTVTPRGLGGAVAGGLGLGGYAVGGPALAVPMLAAQSPRLMGEAAYYTGKLSNLARPLAPLAFDQDASLRALMYGGLGANQ